MSELLGELAPLHPHSNAFPGEVFPRLAADALDGCGALSGCRRQGWATGDRWRRLGSR